MVQYQIFQERLLSDEIGTYTAFGIRAERADRTEVCRISDVFLPEQQAAVFVELLNRHQLSPIHLRDVIEDTLGS